MQSRFQTLLLFAVLLLAGTSGALGVITLDRGSAPKAPLVLMMSPGHAPVEWQGWQLTPPNGGRDCVQNGFDNCSDGQAGDDVIDDIDENAPTSL